MSDNDFNPFMDEEDDIEDRLIAATPAMSTEEASERYVPGQGLSSSRLLDLEDEIDSERVGAAPVEDSPTLNYPLAEELQTFDEPEPKVEPASFQSMGEDSALVEPEYGFSEPAQEEPAPPAKSESSSEELIKSSPFSMGTVGLDGQSAEEFIASISEDDEDAGAAPVKKGKRRSKGATNDGVSDDYNFENPAKPATSRVKLTPKEKALKLVKAPLVPLILLGKPFSIILRRFISGPRTLQAASSALGVLFIMGLVGVYGGVTVAGETTTVSPSGAQATLTDFRLNGGVASAAFTNNSDEAVKGSPAFEVHGRKIGLNIKAFLIPPVVGTCQSQPVTIPAGETVEIKATCDANIDGILKQVVGDFKWM